jgi:flagellar motor protein MotB
MQHRPSPAKLSDNRFHWLGCLALLIFASGCNKPGYYPYPPQLPPNTGYPPPPGYPNPGFPGTFPTAANPTGPQSVYAGGQVSPQLVELQRRAQELDANNRQLTSQLAQMQQQTNVYRERADLLAKQLEDATRQNSQLLASVQQYADQARSMQASMSARGGAKLTANNSLAGAAGSMQIPGAQVLTEGNSIRVRAASDQMFAPGTLQLTPVAITILDQFGSLVARQYPRQRIAVEAHTDASNPAASYQTSTAQAQAVASYLTQRSGLLPQQLLVTGQGANRPIGDNNTPAGRAENRRIELVIYPEGF